MAFKDKTLATRMSDFSNLEIEGDFKAIIDYFNKTSSLHNSIILLMEMFAPKLKFGLIQ